MNADESVVMCCGTYPLIDRPKGYWLIECPKCHCSSGVHADEKVAWMRFKEEQAKKGK